MDPILELKNVNYIYEPGTPYEKHALKDISLSINKGEFVAVLGHTGSGKSTLVQLFDGLIKPTNGLVAFHGEDVFSEGYDIRNLRSKVGLVFQYPEHQLFEATVFSDVCFGPKNLGLSKEDCEAQAKKALEAVGLAKDCYSLSPFELSGGQKRRVAIAGVLAMQPEVLVLDEPSAGLDPRGREDIFNQIEKLCHRDGITIVLVSHSMDEVAAYADRVIVMEQGAKQFDGPTREVFANTTKLRQMGLDIPQTMQIMELLSKQGVKVKTDALSVAEAKEEIMALYQKKVKEKELDV